MAETRVELRSLIEENIPVIDLSSIVNCENSNYEDNVPNDLVEKIGKACEQWGFFQVINHGVSLEVMQRMDSLARKFFAMPIEEKMKAKRPDGALQGFSASGSLYTVANNDTKEAFDFRLHDDEEGKKMWQNVASTELREACMEYAKETENLGFKLMEIFCLSLGANANRLKDHFQAPSSFIRLNHYPPCLTPGLTMGNGNHKDISVFTLLAQDAVGGLEVKRKDGEWIRVTPIPDALVINLGDLAQAFSNDKYESIEHRVVVRSHEDRLSIAHFLFPSRDAMVEPVAESTKRIYKTFNWGEYLVNQHYTYYNKLPEQSLKIRHFKVVE